MLKVLIIHSDPSVVSAVINATSGQDTWIDEVEPGHAGYVRIRSSRPDLVVLEMDSALSAGLENLQYFSKTNSEIPILILTGSEEIQRQSQQIDQRLSCLKKPISVSAIQSWVAQNRRKQQNLLSEQDMSVALDLPYGMRFLGEDIAMQRVFSVIQKISRVATAVLIRGESGTGKELVARALHYNSDRRDSRFVSINCSAVPGNLMESEFFGYEKGAFTGADATRIGKIQYAQGGTLFLDEIGDIPLAMQAKLLRVLQEKVFSPVGSNLELTADIRVIAATHRPLEAMIQRGEFREDLFYRLNVLPIHLPPLRERKEDLKLLVSALIEKFNHRHHKVVTHLTDETMELLKQYDWPGNIRELENVIEYAFVIETQNYITASSLPETFMSALKKGPKTQSLSLTVSENGHGVGLNFQASKREFEKQFLVNALKVYRGKINQTALNTQIPKKTLLRKLGQYGIRAKDYS